MDVVNVCAAMTDADVESRWGVKGIHNREDLVKRVRDTFRPQGDSFEKLTVKDLSGCECYTNYRITTPMPQSLFGDSFGYDMQKDICRQMRDYYAGGMSDEDLNQYFNDCCTEMRKYRAQQHQSSGNVAEDNRKILSQVYEIFAKENARAARAANYDEGAAINAGYGYRDHDWVYYNADYYYQCAETKEALGAMANELAEKWGIGFINTEEIEKNSKMTLDGGFDFNSGWNHTFRNNQGRASIADEATVPPKDFKFFFKEDVGNVGKMEMWINSCRFSKNVSFYFTPDSMRGQRFQANEIMKDFAGQTGDVKGYAGFMEHISIFTGWYARVTGINNHFGNYLPDDNAHWKYG